MVNYEREKSPAEVSDTSKSEEPDKPGSTEEKQKPVAKPNWIKDNIDDINSFIRSANNLNVLLAAVVSYFLTTVWPFNGFDLFKAFLTVVIACCIIFTVLVYIRTAINFWDICLDPKNAYDVDYVTIGYVLSFMVLMTIIPFLSFLVIIRNVVIHLV